MHKFLKVFSPFLAFCLFFSSCATPIELRDRAIIQIMGIDYENGKYKLTLRQYLPTQNKEDSSQKSQDEITQSEGITIFDAIKNAESKDGNQVFYGQCRLYIIGESVLDNKIGQITEFMNSNYQLSLASNILAADTSAEKIVKAKLFNSIAPDISVKRIEGQGKAVDTTVIDTLKDLYNLNGTVCLPLISLKDKDNAVIEKAVIIKDYKKHLTLNDEETMGLCFLNEKISDAVMTAEADGHKLSVGIVSENTKIKMHTNNDKIGLKIKVKAKGNISENGIISSKTANAKYIDEIEKDIQKQIKESIDSALKSIVTNSKTDVLHLFQLLKKTDRELYEKNKNNDAWLSKIRFDVEVDFSVRHSGIQLN